MTPSLSPDSRSGEVTPKVLARQILDSLGHAPDNKAMAEADYWRVVAMLDVFVSAHRIAAERAALERAAELVESVSYSEWQERSPEGVADDIRALLPAGESRPTPEKGKVQGR